MNGFEVGGGFTSNSSFMNEGGKEFAGFSGSDNSLFDASQYAFFGKDIMEEIEIRGLEEDDCVNGGIAVLGAEDYTFPSIGDKGEVDALASLSDIDDLASTFAKLNRTVSGPRSPGVIGDRGSFSRESSSTADWTQDPDFPNCIDQQGLTADKIQEDKRWWSQPHPSSFWIADSKPLNRTSSYPQQQQHHQQQQQQQKQQLLTDPVLAPQSAFTSYPPPGGLSRPLSNLTRHSSIPSLAGSLQIPGSGLSSYSGSLRHLGGLPHGLHMGANMSQLEPPSLSLHSSPKNYWLNQASLFATELSNPMPNLLQQHLSLPKHSLMLQQQQQRSQPSHAQFSFLQPYQFPHHINKFDGVIGISDKRDRKTKSSQRGRHSSRFSQHSSETGSLKSENSLPQFRSKYMSAEEIESILRMQHAATHNSDPYIDDYYHQANIAKRAAISGTKHHFFPTSIKDPPSRSRGSNDQHAHLQVDALGRLLFSSIRRPRPLLEVDAPSPSSDDIRERKSSVKPLEQEPLLAARVTIEDSIRLLLDIDDIDRLLESNSPQEGQLQLRQRRQMLLEVLAASLQLVDPLGPGKPGHSIGLSPKDDLVFLRIVSIPKGRKFLSRFLHLLIPGGDLSRVVCMAIFRHLRFLFGGLPSDSSAAETTNKLAEAVSSCVHEMELSALSACLAAVVCSSEQPPLRPLGSSAGDGASIIIKSVLDQATDLLKDPYVSNNYTINNRALWQASFDAFFQLLTKSCLSKYESIMQMLISQTPTVQIVGSDATRVISREMPVELLRASLPHTNEHQRRMLLEFAQRSMPVTSFSAHGANSGPVTSESVPG